MASIHGFMDGSSDYTHMYNIKDYPGELPTPIIRPNTLFGILKRPEYKCVQFTYLLETLKMVGIYNDSQAHHTLFAPVNMDTSYVSNLDNFEKRQLVLYHTLSKPLPINFLTSSNGMILPTMQTGSSIYISKMNNETYLNKYAKILGSVTVGKNVLVFIDKMLYLDNNPLGYTN